jgi:hypothetical protein
MGYIRHNAIVVTSWEKDNIEKAHTKATKMFGRLVTNITEETISGYRTFLIAPDGSKEGWDYSDKHDDLRAKYKLFLKTLTYEDGSSNINCVEVWYDENGESGIVQEANNGKS